MNWDGLTNSLTGRKDLKKKKVYKEREKKKKKPQCQVPWKLKYLGSVSN